MFNGFYSGTTFLKVISLPLFLLLFFFCNLGIADLKHGKIVTPLPPKATFLDDPLRVLRAIRFGTLISGFPYSHFYIIPIYNGKRVSVDPHFLLNCICICRKF